MASQDPNIITDIATTKLALANSDDDLSSLAQSFLPQLIRFLAIPDQPILRNKVIGTLSHFSKRAKTEMGVKLPLAELLDVFLASAESPFAKNFAQIFVDMGFDRMLPEEKGTFLFKVLNMLSACPSSLRDQLDQMILRSVEFIPIPRENEQEKMKEMIGSDFLTNENSVKELLNLFLDLMLSSPPSSTDSSFVPPGLSELAYKRVLGKVAPTGDQLIARKMAVLKLLRCNVFPDNLTLPVLLAASADYHHLVASEGETATKRLNSLDLENPEVVSALYAMFLGCNGRSPASLNLRLRILNLLMKSNTAANKFPETATLLSECVFGTAAPRLMQTGLQFFLWVIKQATPESLEPYAANMLDIITNLITQLSQQKAATAFDQDTSSRLLGSLYTSLGALSNKCIPLFASRLPTILPLFFSALESQTTSVGPTAGGGSGAESTRVSVMEGLSSLLGTFAVRDGVMVTRNGGQGLDSAILDKVEDLLLQNTWKKDHLLRLAVLQTSNRLFPFSRPIARFVCLLSSDDANLQVREEAIRGLDPLFFKIKDKETREFLPVTWPSFTEMASLIGTLVQTKADMATAVQKGLPKPTTGGKKVLLSLQALVQQPKNSASGGPSHSALSFSGPVYARVLRFLQKCMAQSAAENGIGLTIYVQSLQSEMATGSDPISRYRLVLDSSISQHSTNDLLVSSLTCLASFLSLDPAKHCPLYAPFCETLQKLSVRESSQRVRELAAMCLGSVVASLAQADTLPFLSAFATSIGARDSKGLFVAENVHGSMLSLAHTLALLPNLSLYPNFSELVGPSISAIFELIDSPNALLALGACQSFGIMGRSGSLSKIVAQSEKTFPQKMEIVDRILGVSKNSDTRLAEKAMSALGAISLGEHDQPSTDSREILERVLQGMFGQCEVRSDEVHFTIGQVLACVGGGAWCTAAAQKGNSVFGWEEEEGNDSQDSSKEAPLSPPTATSTTAAAGGLTEDFMVHLLRRLFAEQVMHPKQIVRQNASIWLLCVVKYSGDHPVVTRNLKDVQRAFMSLLSDSNEVTQEVSAKGLSIVYEKSTPEMRQALADSLVDSLMGGRKQTQIKMDEDTELFPKGALGSAPGGGNLTTYKELCAVATDMGQPDLIYKFMSLANHNAVWTAKKAAAFGVSQIATFAGEEFRKRMEKVVPKMYRYQFDPNPMVQTTMSQMWRSCVTDPKKTLDENLQEIMKEVVGGLENSLWRVREASCYALIELLQGRRFSEVSVFVEKSWLAVFRVMDDVKDSCKKAAQSAARSLGILSIKSCNPSYVSLTDAQAALTTVCPVLLHSGLTNAAEDVRNFSIQQLQKIVEASGRAITVVMTELVCTLIDHMSSLEPSMLNYIQLNAEKYNLTGDDVESVRMARAKHTPMADMVDMCLRHVDEEVLKTLLPRLTDIIRNGVGLPTRAAASRAIGTLARFSPQSTRTHSGQLLKTLSTAVQNEKSSALRKAFASSLSFVLALCKDAAVEKFVESLVQLYLTTETEDGRHVVGVVFEEWSKFSSGNFKNFQNEILPLAFVGRFDPMEHIAKTFNNVWVENTADSRSSTRMHSQGISTLIVNLLGASSWAAKRQAGKACTEFADHLNKDDIRPLIPSLLPPLRDSASGRVWEGKDSVVEAFAACVCCAFDQTCSVLLSPETAPGVRLLTNSDAIKLVLRECTRAAKKSHKLTSLKSLRRVATSLNTSSVFAEMQKGLLELASALVEGGGGDEDEDRDDKKETKGAASSGSASSAVVAAAAAVKRTKLVSEMVCEIHQCLATALPKDFSDHAQLNEIMSFLVKQASEATWTECLSILGSLTTMFTRLGDSPVLADLTPENCGAVVDFTISNLSVGKQLKVRVAACELLAVIHASKSGGPLSAHKDRILATAKSLLPETVDSEMRKHLMKITL